MQRVTSKGEEYLIKWKNFPSPQDFTWEPLEHLQEVQELIETFNEALENKTKKKKVEEEKEKEFEPQQEEDKEPSLSSEPELPRKRGRKKGQVKKMEEGKYYPKIVNTDFPRKREKTAKRPESSD